MSTLDLSQLLGEIGDTTELKRSEFARRFFLNPHVPRALRNDPDGSFHFDLQVTDEEGNPLPGLIKDQPIELVLRWYQAEVLDHPRRWKVVRFGRRVGKSFMLAVDAVVEALMNPSAKILVLTPNESHVKLLFDDYIRPLLAVYRHKKSGRIGIPHEPSGIVPRDCDFVVVRDTQKPQEIRIVGGRGHDVTIRGMVISNAARGQSASKLIFDEADYASTDDVRAIVAPIMMTRPNTSIIMSSTPTGRRGSFFYDANTDSKWEAFHRTFEVLPHFSRELWDEMARLAGGEDTNTFQQEYLANFGNQTEGVFNQKALNKCLIVSPYVEVLEETNRRQRSRTPMLAAVRSDPLRRRQAFTEGVRTAGWGVRENPLGSESVYRAEYRGVGIITAGTDWNDKAGMQAVFIWWPPEEWLREGRIKVARFRYEGDEPVVTDRAKDRAGQAIPFVVGSDNGDPGGPHDLTHVKGIVIWQGRLEAGSAHFNWQAAANRVASIMAIPDFVHAWYVDQGYGEQVTKMIEQIMTSGQFIPDGDAGLVPQKAQDIEEPLLRNIRLFHPEQDPEQTQRIFRTINFGAPYPHRDVDFRQRKDLYKDVMVGLTKKMVAGREILFPYGELVGYLEPKQLGSYYEEQYDPKTGTVVEVATAVTDRDRIEFTGGEAARDERAIGGLVTQMREWRVEGYSPSGRPRYAGVDHTIDALMLAILAYHENYSEASESNIFRKHLATHAAAADDVLQTATRASRRPQRAPERPGVRTYGDFQTKDYRSEWAPVEALRRGQAPEEVGTSLADMLAMAGRHIRRHGL